MAAVDGGFVFARFRKERHGFVFGAAGCLVPRRSCAKTMPGSVAVPAGWTKGERTRPIAEYLDKDARPLACTRL